MHGIVLLALFCLPGAAAAQEEAITVVQLCDPQLGMGGYAHDVATFRQAVAQINAAEPDLVVICGDLVNKEGDPEAIRDFLAIKNAIERPCYCVPGNHDVGNDAAERLLALYRDRIAPDYFAVPYQGYLFLGINTQLWKTPRPGETEKMDAWLAEKLAEGQAAGQRLIVFGHHPLFLEKVDEEEEYFNIAPAKRRAVLDLFKKHGVAAYWAGHTHRNMVREADGMPHVASATTSRNFDNAPMGYRVWRLGPDGAIAHEYVAIDGAEPPKE